jgi:hypothetical protein
MAPGTRKPIHRALCDGWDVDRPSTSLCFCSCLCLFSFHENQSTGAPSIAHFTMGGKTDTPPATTMLLSRLYASAVILSAAKDPGVSTIHRPGPFQPSSQTAFAFPWLPKNRTTQKQLIL